MDQVRQTDSPSRQSTVALGAHDTIPRAERGPERRNPGTAYQIQQLKLGGILDQAISLTKNHFGLLFTIMAMVYIPAALVMSFVQLTMLPPQPTSPEEIVAYQQAYLNALPILVVPLLVTALILMPLANAAVVDAVARLYLGKPTSAMESLKVGISKIVPLLGTSILVGLAIMGGAFLLIIRWLTDLRWKVNSGLTVQLSKNSMPPTSTESKCSSNAGADSRKRRDNL